jgi:hypothetical protein
MYGPTEDEFLERADLQEGVAGQARMYLDEADMSRNAMHEVRRPRSMSTDTPAPDEPPDNYYGPFDYL